MNIPRQLLTMIDAMMVQARIEIEGKPVRRALTVAEVLGLQPKSKDILTNEVYRWDPRSDTFASVTRSSILEKVRKKNGLTKEEVEQDVLRKKTVLEWMVKNNIRRHTDVANVIREYYADPTRVYRKARMGAP